MEKANIIEKENNFVSVVAYMHNDSGRVTPFLTRICNELTPKFKAYEIILVNDRSTDNCAKEIKEFKQAGKTNVPITVINMSLHQGLELCMNAALDLSIGDFVFEFDTLSLCYEPKLIIDAYEKALSGNDIVSVSPQKGRNIAGGLFYKIFNSASKSDYKIRTDIFRVLSRRAINRVHSITANLPYRKAAYATSGLAMAQLFTQKEQTEKTSPERFALALDSLALYTDTAYKLSLGIALTMLAVTVFELLYTVYVYFGTSKPVEGWATTMGVLTFGFFGVFLILALVIKYLSLLVDLIFKKQKYLVEGIEKI